LAGKTKETSGRVTGDDRLEAGGRTQHDTAEGKEAVKSAVDKAKGGGAGHQVEGRAQGNRMSRRPVPRAGPLRVEEQRAPGSLLPYRIRQDVIGELSCPIACRVEFAP
jgi:uncharacterized protein YjbJ (UPF0337 family)